MCGKYSPAATQVDHRPTVRTEGEQRNGGENETAVSPGIDQNNAFTGGKNRRGRFSRPLNFRVSVVRKFAFARITFVSVQLRNFTFLARSRERTLSPRGTLASEMYRDPPFGNPVLRNYDSDREPPRERVSRRFFPAAE